MKAYFIPGLAANEKIFKHLRLPEGWEPVYINWIKPTHKESLRHYAQRLAESIDTSRPFILVGLSLGGMIATEIASRYRPEKVVLISSIPCSGDLPPYFRIAGKLKLHKIVPVRLFKSASLLKRFFTTETSADKAYLRKAIRESDPAFVRWAIDAILTWQLDRTVKCIHIHGSDDMLLPTRYTKPDYLIKGGGHMMIMNRAAEISSILKEIFNPQPA